MTLLTTEFHNGLDPNNAFIVFAADRRICKNGLPAGDHLKIFEIPRLNAGVGYFGLAEVPASTSSRPMQEWLKEILDHITGKESLEQFAESLAEALNSAIPRFIRGKYISGFHIAGFGKSDYPEFWYVRNVDDDRETIFGDYRVREDFQRQHKSELKPGQYWIYRNGDIRAHVLAWENIDKSFNYLLRESDFKEFRSPNDYLEWVKFKMELIADLYERFCRYSIIGKLIDAFLLSKARN